MWFNTEQLSSNTLKHYLQFSKIFQNYMKDFGFGEISWSHGYHMGLSVPVSYLHWIEPVTFVLTEL